MLIGERIGKRAFAGVAAAEKADVDSEPLGRIESVQHGSLPIEAVDFDCLTQAVGEQPVSHQFKKKAGSWDPAFFR